MRYCAVAVTDTLQSWEGMRAGDHDGIFYFRLPDAWDALGLDELESKIWDVGQRMYRDLNDGFHRAEPDDTSSIVLVRAYPLLLSAERIASKPWLTAPNPAVWESTPCVIVADDGSYRKVARDEF